MLTFRPKTTLQWVLPLALFLLTGSCGKPTATNTGTKTNRTVKSFPLSGNFDTRGIHLSWKYPDVVADEWSVQRQTNGSAPKRLARLAVTSNSYNDLAVTDYAIYRYRIVGKRGTSVVARSRSKDLQYFSWAFKQVEPDSAPINTYLEGLTAPIIFTHMPFQIPVTSNWPLVYFDCAFNLSDSFYADCPERMLFTKQFGNFVPSMEQWYTLYIRARGSDGTLDPTPLPVTFLTDFTPPAIAGHLVYNTSITSDTTPFGFVFTNLYDMASTSVVLSFSGDIPTVSNVRVDLASIVAVDLPVPTRTGRIEVQVTATDEAGHMTGPITCIINLPQESKGAGC